MENQENGEYHSIFEKMHKHFMDAIKNEILNKGEGNKSKKSRSRRKKKGRKSRPEKILGSVVKSGQLILLVKFKNNDDIAYIPISQAKADFPDIVIDYFRTRLNWHPIEQNN